MTEYFRITGKNLIQFDAGATGNYLFTQGRPPRKLSTVLTRQEISSLLPSLPLGIRPLALMRGLSVITMEANIQGATDTDMEAKEHDLIETLVETELYFSSQGTRGTKAELVVKSDGAVNTSYKSVYYGVLDELDSRDVLGAIIKAHRLEGLRLTLYCEKNWRPASAIELGPNELKNPSFERDSNADGLADNWSIVGAPTLTIEPTIVLHGCQSQKIVTDNAADEGIFQSGLVAPAGTTKVVAYAWIHREEPGDDIRVRLYDLTAPALRDAQLYDTAGWLTAQDAGGRTWKRIVVCSNAIIAGNNHELRIYRSVAGATQVTTFYVDKTFLKWGTTTAPDEWIDHCLVYNHNDSHVGHINHLDVADLKGDVEARIRLIIDATVGASYRDVFEIARRTRGAPCALVHFREAEVATPSNWTPTADTTCSGTDGGAGVSKLLNTGNASGSATWTINNPSANLRGRFRLLARAKTNDAVNTGLRVGVRFSALDSYKYNPWQLLPLVSQWDRVNLKTVFLDPASREGGTLARIEIIIEYRKDAADTVELDCIMLLPEDESVMGLDQPGTLAGQHVLDDTGDFPYWGLEVASAYSLHVMKSSNLMLIPQRENRLYFVEHWGNGRWQIHHETANWFTRVSLGYLPQFISPLE